MKEYPFTLPGHENISFTLRPGDMLNSVKVFCDGKPMKLSWGKFRTTLPNGEEIVLRLKYSIDIFSPKVVFGKQLIQIFPSRPKYQMILTYLPLILVAEGGAIGGLCGGVAAYINFCIFKSQLSLPLKITFTILTTLAAIMIFVTAASFVHIKTK